MIGEDRSLGNYLTERLLSIWFLTLIVSVNKELWTRTVPVNKELLTGTVPVNKELVTVTVQVNNELLTGMVPVNNLFHLILCIVPQTLIFLNSSQ